MVSLVPIGLLALVQGIKSGRALQEKNQNDLADMVSLFVEYVKGVPLLKAFSESEDFREKTERQASENSGESSKQTSKYVAAYLGRYNFF